MGSPSEEESTPTGKYELHKRKRKTSIFIVFTHNTSRQVWSSRELEILKINFSFVQVLDAHWVHWRLVV
jgi:hypothetical protein